MSGFLFIGALNLSPYIVRDISLANGRFFELAGAPSEIERDIRLIFIAFNSFAEYHRELLVLTDKGRFRPHSTTYRVHPDDTSRYTLSRGGIYIDLFKRGLFWSVKEGINP